MTYIVKQAFSLSLEEQTARGIVGIPQDWPIESYLYINQEIPVGFSIMTEEEITLLKSNNQASYDAWLAPKMTAAPIPAPNNVAIISMPAPEPFAVPTFRTKRNAIANIVSVNAGTSAYIDFILPAERYISGGTIMAENAELGDYVIATVEDSNGLIPEIYRAILCEAYPIASTYIEKEFIEVTTPGSIVNGSITVHDVSTYPLNAKITQGLCLRITYYAANSGLTRRIGVNYHLTKKL